MNASNTDGCVTGCKLARCGDGYLYGGTEQCDDGNTVDEGVCSPDCQLTGCPAGMAACDSSPDNGCETNIDTSVLNCGGCNAACSPAHATPVCTGGHCEVASCLTPYDDCNGLDSDGCEVDLSSDSANCGSCNASCAAANTIASLRRRRMSRRRLYRHVCGLHRGLWLRDGYLEQPAALRRLQSRVRTAERERGLQQRQLQRRGVYERLRQLQPRRCRWLRSLARHGREQLRHVRHGLPARACRSRVLGRRLLDQFVRRHVRELQRTDARRLRSRSGHRPTQLRQLRQRLPHGCSRTRWSAAPPAAVRSVAASPATGTSTATSRTVANTRARRSPALICPTRNLSTATATASTATRTPRCSSRRTATTAQRERRRRRWQRSPPRSRARSRPARHRSTCRTARTPAASR